MSVKRAITLIVLLAMGALLVAGVSVLFDLRFEGGDNYPPYSTLRADPLGARAFYDSLKGIAELDVARNLRPLCELKEGAGTTLFYLGVETKGLRWFSGDDSRHLEEFLMDGGRVVLTLAPEVRDPFRNTSASGSGAFTSSTLATTSSLPKLPAPCTSATLTAKSAKATSATLAKTDSKKSDPPTSLPAIYPLPRSIRKAESEEAERQKREQEEEEKRAQAAPT